MPQDVLLQAVVDSVKPPDDHSTWNDESLGAVYELLLGAAACLSASRFTIECRSSMQNYEPSRVKLWPALLKSAARVDARNPNLDWTHKDLVLWSSGLFLNKAQANVASALDRTINILIASSQFRSLGEELLHTWPGTRLRFLEALDLPTNLADIVTGLIEHSKCTDLYQEDKNYPGIGNWLLSSVRETAMLRDLITIVDYIREKIRPELCVLATFERFNWLKHNPSGRSSRIPLHGGSGNGSLVEWGVTAIGLECAANFWRAACLTKHRVGNRGELKRIKANKGWRR